MLSPVPLRLSHEATTLGVYSSDAAKFAARYEASDRGVLQDRLGALFAPGWKVLELGCGSGAEAAHLHRLGIEMFPTDGSAEMLREAAKFHPELMPRLNQLPLPGMFPFEDGFFDGLIASAVLLHLSPEALSDVAKEMHRVVRPGGIIYVLHTPERSGLDPLGQDTEGRFFNRMSTDSLIQILASRQIYVDAVREVPDALGRSGVRVEEILLRPSASPIERHYPPREIRVPWHQIAVRGGLPSQAEDYPPLEVELSRTGNSKREISRCAVSPEFDLVLVPTLGCFVPGYTLAVPTRPALSFGALSAEELRPTSIILEQWRQRMQEVFGDVIVAEHGSSEACVATAACVSQAHIHFIPVPGVVDQLEQRYRDAGGGPPDAVLGSLTELPKVVDGEPYVLFSPRAGTYQVWLKVEKFRRQFVRRETADLLGLPFQYNWRSHPFTEQMELTASLLGAIFSPGTAGPEAIKEGSLVWESPYDDDRFLDPSYNPHVVLFGSADIERLLFFAGCRARGVAEEALDQLRRLAESGSLSRLDGIRAQAAAESAMRSNFDTCTSRAADALRQALESVVGTPCLPGA